MVRVGAGLRIVGRFRVAVGVRVSVRVRIGWVGSNPRHASGSSDPEDAHSRGSVLRVLPRPSPVTLSLNPNPSDKEPPLEDEGFRGARMWLGLRIGMRRVRRSRVRAALMWLGLRVWVKPGDRQTADPMSGSGVEVEEDGGGGGSSMVVER